MGGQIACVFIKPLQCARGAHHSSPGLQSRSSTSRAAFMFSAPSAVDKDILLPTEGHKNHWYPNHERCRIIFGIGQCTLRLCVTHATTTYRQGEMLPRSRLFLLPPRLQPYLTISLFRLVCAAQPHDLLSSTLA